MLKNSAVATPDCDIEFLRGSRVAESWFVTATNMQRNFTGGVLCLNKTVKSICYRQRRHLTRVWQYQRVASWLYTCSRLYGFIISNTVNLPGINLLIALAFPMSIAMHFQVVIAKTKEKWRDIAKTFSEKSEVCHRFSLWTINWNSIVLWRTCKHSSSFRSHVISMCGG